MVMSQFQMNKEVVMEAILINKQQKITLSMSLTGSQGARYKHDWVKLPKLATTKGFRIRSASKQRLNREGATVQTRRKDVPQVFMSSDKYRSNSLKSTNSRKSITKKSQVGNSSDEENSEVASYRMSSKVFTKNHQKTIERDHIQNMEKLERIAKLFDPKTIMKMGRKNSENSHEESRKQNKSGKAYKGQFRMNQYIFQSKPKKKSNKKEKADEFWKQVNQSLILPQGKVAEDQVSKDLRQIYETFVTE